MLRKFAHNQLGRDFVLGDLHGEYDRLQQLLKMIQFNESTDRMFSVGDLIDRGPESDKCLTLLDEPWFFAVKGNHEDMLVDAYRDPAHGPDFWHQNGGMWGKSLDRDQLRRYAEKLNKLPVVITVGHLSNEELANGSSLNDDMADIKCNEHRFNVFHAEFFGNDEQLDAGQYTITVHERLLWGRGILTANKQSKKLPAHQTPGLSPSFCGHTPVPKPIRIGSHIFIDTGCGKSKSQGYLSAVNPRTMEFFHY